jgi:hypothetical protein
MARTWWDENDDKVRFVLEQNVELDVYSASSLIPQSVDRHISPLGHIILIPSQPVFILHPKWWILTGEATHTRFIKVETLLTIGYANVSHVTNVFIAKYLFTGSVKILNKIVFKIAMKCISMRNPEISYCLYSEIFK